MPDPLRQTISATEVPALWNVSPYVTRWMLHKKFADAMEIEKSADARMDWGLRMEPLIQAQAAADLKMEIIPNAGRYHRRGLVGCTRDAIVICPDRGPGTLETKCVFDYRTWMQAWAGGEVAPRHYEIQTQVQMMVGDVDGPYKWGVIAAWVAGEMHYFERAPIPELWANIETEAGAFFEAVKSGREPDPFGAPVEVPFLSAIDRVPGKVIELADDELTLLARKLNEVSKAATDIEKVRKDAKARLLAAAGDAEELRLPGGVSVRFKVSSRAGYEVKPTTMTTVKVYVPGEE